MMNKYTEKRVIPMDRPILQRLISLCDKNPNGFILCGTEQEKTIVFDQLDPKAAQKHLVAYGEVMMRAAILTKNTLAGLCSNIPPPGTDQKSLQPFLEGFKC